MKGEALSLVVVCWVCDTLGGQDLGMMPELGFIVILLFCFNLESWGQVWVGGKARPRLEKSRSV